MSKVIKLEESWKRELSDQFSQPYWHNLTQFVRSEYAQQVVYPPAPQIFRALDSCPFDAVRVVIVGQDPYHGPNQACGLAFAVEQGVAQPPSLKNIRTELLRDIYGITEKQDVDAAQSLDLHFWPAQGVLLLNSVLTVRAGQAASHAGKGWEQFTDAVLAKLNQKRTSIVYMLWGNYAQKKGALIDQKRNLVLKSGHPSPLSVRYFSKNNHFSLCNAYLQLQGLPPIMWLRASS